MRERPKLGIRDDSRDIAEPVGLLESLPSFRPEIYTMDVSFHHLVTCAPCALEANEFVRVNEYTVFCYVEPRRWVTITVTIATSVDSKLWNLVPRSSAEDSSAALRHSFSPGVNVALGTTLSNNRSTRHGAHFCVFVGGAKSVQGSPSVSHPRAQLSKPRFDSRSYLQEVTLITHHWRVARYYESALDRRPLAPNTFRFAAWLGSCWVEETMFGTQNSAIDTQFYVLKVSHALQDITGHSRVLGLAIDDSGTVSGFLRELPLQGVMRTYIRQSGHLVRPEQLWAWCEQLVRAVTEAHDAGFVIGTLASYCTGSIGLNAELRVVVHRYTAHFEKRRSEPGRTPPEYKHATKEKMRASAESDLYQLGLHLWSIAIRNVYPVPSAFCQLAGCLTKKPINCREPHSTPIQLSWPDIEVPQYLRTAVEICRSEKPEDRWPAWKLLTLFPTFTAESVPKIVSGAQSADASRSPPGIQRLEDYRGSEDWLRCDWCSRSAIKHHFYCNICMSSDFDVCPACFFTQGRHCYDNAHFLQERRMGPEIRREYGNFYSSVMANGKREILEV